MFFGGINGFNAFDPENIKDNAHVPPVVFTDFLLAQNPVSFKAPNSPLKKAIGETDEITLSYRDNIFALEFAALDFAAPQKNRYAYKMENFQEGWIEAGTHRVATFTNLDPGEYVFRVRASNNDGIWNKEGVAIKITITPPWWRTRWAYAIYALLVMAGVFATDRIQRRRVIAKERERAQIREAELRAEAAELQAKVLEAENARKTHELEEARKLQLSMLPKTVPQLPDLDIAVHMQTATEVGGDYYDFHHDEDGTLTAVIGDATGHGTKAGIMVAILKSLFSGMSAESDILRFFDQCTSILKKMNLGNLYMALSCVRIKAQKMRVASAGMPPVLIYRAATNAVEEIIMKTMPLGAHAGFPYEQKEIDLTTGDTILLMTDGFAELFNDQEEILDYPAVVELFKEAAGKSPAEIIGHLYVHGEKWRNGQAQRDDITFVVMKVMR